ncbi:uncharacterized protein [Nicotiana sylvestris]|uniref:uncharacterized protein n=1 Tax=Nicotiana sylvestris TaxID=4096 RepID=UPI00388C5D57
MGYYWPTMVKDCLDYARRGKDFQFHANFIYQPPEVLHPTVASWPFDAWGLDVIGLLSKWAEVISLKEVKKENVANFIRVNIIYQFGISRYILTDNVLPLERQIPSLRLAIQKGLTDEENAWLLLEELEALDEKRLESQQSLECYQACLSRSFNKRVRLRSFPVGDQVLVVKRPIIISRRSVGKFSAKWDGPYIVQEVYSSGAYKIVDSEGLWIGPINGKLMKRYYP